MTVLIIIIPFWGFIRETAAVRKAVEEALLLCGKVLIPSLLPAMVLTNLLLETGVSELLGRPAEKLMRFCFRLPGECAPVLVMGAAAGYPVGAKGAISLYEKGRISKSECERLMAFCNNSGPAFLFGTLGMMVFSSAGAGWILFLSHLAASLSVGFLFRFYRTGEPVDIYGNQRERTLCLTAGSFTKSVSGTAENLMHMTAYVLFFSAINCVLSESGILSCMAACISKLAGMSESRWEALLTGLIEMTGGIFHLSLEGDGVLSALPLAAFLVGWAGFSVHFQVLSFLGENRLSVVPYFTGKLLHGVLSAFYTMVLSRLICVETAMTFTSVPTLEGSRLFVLSILTGTGITLFFLFCVLLFKRDFDK